MDEKQAEIRALGVLEWLVHNDELLQSFLDATGADEADLRTRAGEPAFLGSVLDFLMQNDAWVVEYCDGAGVPYDMPMKARQALPGGADVNWT